MTITAYTVHTLLKNNVATLLVGIVRGKNKIRKVWGDSNVFIQKN